MGEREYDILMIAPTSFFADYGCHVRILEEARVLQRLGQRVTICTYHQGRDIAGLDIRRTLPIPWRKGWEVGSSRHKIAFDVLLSATTLITTLRHRPHIIHAHLHEGGLIGWVLSKLWRVPLVFDFQGSLTSEMIDHRFLHPDGLFYRPLRWLEERIDHFPQAIITSSHHASELLQREFHCDPARIHPVPDCVNAEVFHPDALSTEERRALKEHWGIPLERQVVVYLGLLADYQGIPHLLRAAQRVVAVRPQTHFLLMGYPGVEGYRAYAERLGLGPYTTFTGKIPYEEAPRYLALGDVAVAPKLSATEGSGKLLNYMAMALPTVAFDTPVSREYLAEWGVYAQPGDEEELAAALLSLLDNEPRRRELGRRLRERAVALYSWRQAGQRILEIYAEACNNRRM